MTVDQPDFTRTTVYVSVAVSPTADQPDFTSTAFAAPGSSVGGYASLTGPGETASPGDLVQFGGFEVNDSVGGDGIHFETIGEITFIKGFSYELTFGPGGP